MRISLRFGRALGLVAFIMAPSFLRTVEASEIRVVQGLLLSLPATIQEGRIATATVAFDNSPGTPVTVTLKASTAEVILPESVVIPAGRSSTSFKVQVIDNPMVEGSRSVEIIASAAAFTGDAKGTVVRDNEVVTYAFGNMPDVVNVGGAVSLNVTARDVEGNIINFDGSVNLSLILPNGKAGTVQPSSVQLSGPTGWVGSITLPGVQDGPLRIRGEDAQGIAAESLPFDPMRILNLPTADLVFDSSRNRFYASVPSSSASPYAGRVVSIDPTTMQVTSGAQVEDPGPLMLTSGGEALYVGLNGNAAIARIDPMTLALQSSFPVGSDPTYGTLAASEIIGLQGQPDKVIVARVRIAPNAPPNGGLAVYKNGVPLQNKLLIQNAATLRATADPAIFVLYDKSTYATFRRVGVNASGLVDLGYGGAPFSGSTLFPYYTADIQSDGNLVGSSNGVVVDSGSMQRLGKVVAKHPIYLGPVRPDRAANRIYFLEGPHPLPDTRFEAIGVYDPASFALIRRFTAPGLIASGSLLRWGECGLAFRGGGSVSVIASRRIVPRAPGADLSASVEVGSALPAIGEPIIYRVRVENHEPQAARNAFVQLTFSAGEVLKGITVPAGAISAGPNALAFGDMAAGTSVEFTATTVAQSPGIVWCNATVSSESIDPDFTNNTGFEPANAGYGLASNEARRFRFTANNLLYDSTRQLLWASIPDSIAGPLGPSIVSLDPLTGTLSDPIPLARTSVPDSMALSRNGRYLYVGLLDADEIQRVDLESHTSVRIPLVLNWVGNDYAADLEVLDGDGTSFVVVRRWSVTATVYDNAAVRPGVSSVISRIEKTATPNVFMGYNRENTGFQVIKLIVSSSGVTTTQSVRDLIGGFGTDIRASGNLLLSTTGILVDSDSLTLKSNFGSSGRACLDAGNGRAFLVNGSQIRGFDTLSGLSIGNLTLPTTSAGDWATLCVRWGADGLAVLGPDGNLYVARWPAAFGGIQTVQTTKYLRP